MTVTVSHRSSGLKVPGLGLDEAVNRATRAYLKVGLEAVTTDTMAQHLGYRHANNGTALTMLAALRLWGLLQRPRTGHLAVAPALAQVLQATEGGQREAVLMDLLRQVPVFGRWLNEYPDALPADDTLAQALQAQGASPAGARMAVAVFKQSLAFAQAAAAGAPASPLSPLADGLPATSATPAPDPPAATTLPPATQPEPGLDHIPVRLPGGRRAWLLVPAPLLKADKARLKAQIDLLLADDEGD